MDNCDAVKFYVDIINGLPTNERQIEAAKQNAEEFFEFMDEEQLQWLDGNSTHYRLGNG